jgi:secreted PhoX family phosphatase
VAAQTITVLYDAADFPAGAPLTGVDNVVVSSAGDLYVAEDGGNMEINIITADRVRNPDGTERIDRIVAPVVRYPDNDRSEITGPVFDPSGTRLYFSSQRGPAPAGPGITFEVRGPFRVVPTTPAAGPATTAALSR